MSLASVLMAQETEKALAENPMRAGCTYHSYEAPADVVTTPAPKGYKPVYISHYGRHGSRYHSAFMIGQNYPRELIYADSLGLLTDTGKVILEELLTVYRVHGGMLGELSQKGFKEHQGIAERMYASFPEIWKNRKSVNCISSNYSRCVLSMGAFTGRLQALDPKISVSAVTGKKYFGIVAKEVEYHEEAVEEVAQKLGNTGRILVRESGTEPVIRVMVEAATKEECQQYVDDVVDVICRQGHARV